jgi:hypothetical protein
MLLAGLAKTTKGDEGNGDRLAAHAKMWWFDDEEKRGACFAFGWFVAG